MMPSSLAALIVAWSVLATPDGARVPPAPKPTFSVMVLTPNVDVENNRCSCFVCGNFQTVPTQLQVKIFLRETDPVRPENATVSPASVCVQTSTRVAPAPECQHFALTAYHRIATSLVGATVHDERAGGPLDDSVMHGVDALARVFHRIDSASLAASVYVSLVEPFGRPQQGGMMRDATNLSNGQFLGFIDIPVGNPVKLEKHVKVEFWSGPVRLATYQDADGNEWLPVPW